MKPTLVAVLCWSADARVPADAQLPFPPLPGISSRQRSDFPKRFAGSIRLICPRMCGGEMI